MPGVLSVRQLAFRPIRIGRRERRQDLFPPDIEFRQRCRIDQDTHGGTRTPLNIDDSDAWDLSNLLIEDRVGNVVHLGAFLDPGGQRQNNYRLVRRVLLPVPGIVRQGCRQLTASGVDRRLHVTRGRVDVPVQVELHGDISRAGAAVRRHLGDSGNSAERALERRRHRRCHRFGAGTGKIRRYIDRRIFDLRKRRDGQEVEPERAGHGQRKRQKRCCDRPFDERCRDTHGSYLFHQHFFLDPVTDSQTAQPDSNSIERQIDDWNGVKREKLADSQPADNRDTQRMPQLGTNTGSQR